MKNQKDKSKSILNKRTRPVYPLVRFNYMPRIIAFILHGIILITIFYASRSIFLWSIIFLQVIVWPHIAYLHGKYSRNPRAAEYRNLYFETFLCGVWMNVVSFQLWPSTVFLIGAVMDLLATRGWGLFKNALLFWVMGILVAGAFNGFDYIPESSIATAYACIFFIVIYTSIVAVLSFKTSKKLSVSKQRTETIFNSVQSGVLVIDVESHKIIEVNPAAAKMIGVAGEKIVGHVCHRFICPAQKCACPITDLQQREDSSERVLLNKDGKEIPILKTVIPFILEGRECLLESFIDISERKQMEEELRRLARAVEQSSEGIAVADMDGNIEFVNSAWAQMHGYRPDEVLGKHLKIFHTTEQLLTDVNPFNDLVMKNGSHQAEVGHARKDGSTFPTRMTATLLKDDDGNPIGLLGIVRDITERKQAESALKITLEKVESVNVHLEQQTALANEMAEKAEAANIAKSRFLANMSHEIRTPMNAVVGMSHLLADTELSDEQKHFVKIIQQSADSLLNIINDILDFSKIEAGKLDLELIDFDLIQLLKEINGMMEIEARDKDLQYFCQVDPAVPQYVSGDPGRIRQVLVNLVGNAVKFTHKGKIQIQVNRIPGKKPADERQIALMFKVIDTGIGISPDKIQTLFDAFTQVDASTTRKFGGTGLGLSIAKNLIEMMGGHLDVSSQEGKGSVFTFTVPLKKGVSAAQIIAETGKTSPMASKETSAMKEKHRARILVAEDFSINQEVVRGFLENFGFSVHIVENGMEAIHALEKHRYDLVLMDVQMPKMDGIEATRVIRDPESRVLDHHIAIVALTGHAMAGDRYKFVDAGMNDYLPKPINPDTLYDVVMRNLPEALKGVE